MATDKHMSRPLDLKLQGCTWVRDRPVGSACMGPKVPHIHTGRIIKTGRNLDGHAVQACGGTERPQALLRIVGPPGALAQRVLGAAKEPSTIAPALQHHLRIAERTKSTARGGTCTRRSTGIRLLSAGHHFSHLSCRFTDALVFTRSLMMIVGPSECSFFSHMKVVSAFRFDHLSGLSECTFFSHM